MLTANYGEAVGIVFFLLHTETHSKLLSKKKQSRPSYCSSNSHAASHQFSIKVFFFRQEYYTLSLFFFFLWMPFFAESQILCPTFDICSFSSVTIIGLWSARHVFDNLLTRPQFAFLLAIIEDFVICWLLTAFHFDHLAVPFFGVWRLVLLYLQIW